MKIAVLLKTVPDTASTPAVTADGKSIDTEGLEFVLNPYDEFALEEAIRLKESVGGDVVAISLGGSEARKGIRTALAMGADRGILIAPPGTPLSSRTVSKILAACVKPLAPDLILAGKQAVDDDGAQVAERVAEILGFSHASAVSRCRIDEGTAVVNREIEGGHYVMELPLPALLTADKGLNIPRYPSLPAVLKAKNKELREITAADLGLDEGELCSHLTTEKVFLPRQERRKRVLGGDGRDASRELVSLLRAENIAV